MDTPKRLLKYEWLKNTAKNDIEIEGVKKATADAFLASLDGMNRMTLGNEVLTNKKIETEIKMLEKKSIKWINQKIIHKKQKLLKALIKLAGVNDD